MKLLGEIKESDIFPGQTPTPEHDFGELRTSVRVVLFDVNRKIAMGYYPPSQYNEMDGSYHLPGGGVDKGEMVLRALQRECLEETGCRIKNVKELGLVKEYGVGKSIKHIQHTYCFTAEVDGEKLSPRFTDREIQDKLEVCWFLPVDAQNIINNEKLSFSKSRDLLCLQEVVNQYCA